MCSGSNQAPSESTAVRFTGAPRGGRDASVGQGRHIGRQMVVVEGESGTVVTGERSGDRFDLPAGDHVHRPGVILDLQQRQRAVRQGGQVLAGDPGDQQPDQGAQLGIKIATAGVPIVFALLGFIALSFLPYSRSVEAELSEYSKRRRGSQTAFQARVRDADPYAPADTGALEAGG